MARNPKYSRLCYQQCHRDYASSFPALGGLDPSSPYCIASLMHGGPRGGVVLSRRSDLQHRLLCNSQLNFPDKPLLRSSATQGHQKYFSYKNDFDACSLSYRLYEMSGC
eukprot:4885806-Amphidinium_carterae.1